jgi:phage shock protein PspC (stress-responsive transcriptional regulator)
MEQKTEHRAHEEHTKKLYRSRKDKIVAGVAAGIAEYFSIDPIIARLVFFILIFTSGGFMFLVYIVLAIVVPQEPGEEMADRKESLKGFVEGVSEKAETLASEFQERRDHVRDSYNRKRTIAGIILVGIGLVALLNEFFPMHWFRWSVVWPSALVILGAMILFRK